MVIMIIATNSGVFSLVKNFYKQEYPEVVTDDFKSLKIFSIKSDRYEFHTILRRKIL